MNGFLRYALDYPVMIILPACGFLVALVVLRLKTWYIKGAATHTASSKCIEPVSEERPGTPPPEHRQNSVDLSDATSQLIGLAEDVSKGAEIRLTRGGAPYVAIIDARKLDHYHALEADFRQRILLSDAESGLKDAIAGKTISEDEFRKNSKSDPK